MSSVPAPRLPREIWIVVLFLGVSCLRAHQGEFGLLHPSGAFKKIENLSRTAVFLEGSPVPRGVSGSAGQMASEPSGPLGSSAGTKGFRRSISGPFPSSTHFGHPRTSHCDFLKTFLFKAPPALYVCFLSLLGFPVSLRAGRVPGTNIGCETHQKLAPTTSNQLPRRNLQLPPQNENR